MEPLEELRYLVLGAQREGARALAELLRPTNLTAAQAEVIAVLRDADGPLSLRQVGERLVCEGGSPSRLVASVVDAGFVARGERPGDRRAVELSLTPKGEAVAEQVTDAERQLYEWIGNALSDRDVTAAVRVMRKLVAGGTSGEAIARRRAARSATRLRTGSSVSGSASAAGEPEE